MAPGFGALPPAASAGGLPHSRRRDAVEVAEPLNRYLASAAQAQRAGRSSSPCASSTGCPFPWRFSRAEPRGAPGLPAPARGFEPAARRATCCCSSRCSTGLGYGNDARVRAAVGYEMRCEVARRAPRRPAPGRGLGDLSPPARRRGVRRGDRRLRRRRRGRGGDPRRGRARGGRARGRARTWTARTYPDEPLAALAALYRDGGLTIAEGRPAIPTPGRPRGRRHDGDQLGHLLPGARSRCSRAGRAEHGIEWADRARPRLRRRPRRCSHVRPVDPERMGRNGQLLREGAEALGRQPRAAAAQRRRAASSAAPARPGCRLDAKRAMHVSYLPRAVAAGARVRAAGRGSADRLRGRPGHRASTAWRGANGHGRRPFAAPRPARRSCSPAAPSGPRSCCCARASARRAASSGRNLRIHPACWVGRPLRRGGARLGRA